MKNSALVVIDLQNDITKNYREIIENVNEAIDWAVRKDLWVIYMYKIAANAQVQRIVSTPVSLTKYILLASAVMTWNTDWS